MLGWERAVCSVSSVLMITFRRIRIFTEVGVDTAYDGVGIHFPVASELRPSTQLHNESSTEESYW